MKKIYKKTVYLGLLVTVAMSFFVFPKISHAATSVTQHGITWTFDGDYTVGQFVNGDYWVVDSGDGIIVNGVSPSPHETATDVYNGSMKNPVVSGAQCFDSRASNFSPDLCLNAPFEINTGDSLMSSISKEAFTTDWAGGSIDSHTPVGAVSVLSVLLSVPPEGSFRPAYTDREQTLYNISNLDLSKLPRLSATEIVHPLSYYERGLERPWILFGKGTWGYGIHASQNMFEYLRDINTFLSEASLFMMTDTPNIDTLVTRFCQLGIDKYYLGKQGLGDTCYYVPPTLFTGILLDDIDMQNLFTDGNLLAEPRDYPDFYYWADRTSAIFSTIVPEGKTWSGHTVFYRNQMNSGEHEHLHPSEWDDPISLDHWKNETYRTAIDSHGHVGMVLSAVLLGNNAKQLWGHDATFDYIDRWMAADTLAECLVMEEYDKEEPGGYGVNCEGLPRRGGNDFVNTMWDTYRPNYPYQLNFRSDVDNSSQINTTDALLTLRNSLGLSMSATAWQIWTTTGDANCDGDSNSTDALLILRHSLGLSMSGTTWCGDMTN